MEKVLIQKPLDRGLPGMNQVILIGNIGKDPSVFETQGGSKIMRFSMATNNYVLEGRQEYRLTEWHDVFCDGQLASRASTELKKGSRVQVVGHLFKSKFKRMDGSDMEKTEVQATFVSRLEEGKAAPGMSAERALIQRELDELKAKLASMKTPEIIPGELSADIPDEEMGILELTEDEMNDIMSSEMVFVNDNEEGTYPVGPTAAPPQQGNPFLQ